MPKHKHGHWEGGKGSPTYRSWAAAKHRCQNKSCPDYPSYGGRGIALALEWNDFKQFLSDMGERPEGTTLDRIDNDKGYEPGNCRWLTHKEQCRNLRRNVEFEHNGKTQCIAAWAEEFSLSRGVLRKRLIVLEWPMEKALTTPVRKYT